MENQPHPASGAPAKTSIGVVETAEGPIRHREVSTPQGVIFAPVRVLLGVRESDGAPFPEKAGNGSLVFALPGGGRFVAA